MLNPRISTILPLYNNKNDILDAIKSVEAQTYTDWELIIVDDCSNDGSYELVKQYIVNKPKITLIRTKQNSGCYICMNSGLIVAKGEYINRIDSDDTFDKRKLELQLNILDNNIKVVGVESFYTRGNKINENGIVTLMYRKTIIDKIGYYDSVRFCADSEFKNRIYKKYGKSSIYKIKQPLYFAKIRENSLTRSNGTGQFGTGNVIRKDYIKKFQIWHSHNNLYMDYPLTKRPFSVNSIMLP